MTPFQPAAFRHPTAGYVDALVGAVARPRVAPREEDERAGEEGGVPAVQLGDELPQPRHRRPHLRSARTTPVVIGSR